MRRTLILLTSLVALMLRCTGTVQAQDAATMLRDGIRLEEVNGEPHRAMATFKELIERYPASKSEAAQAQLHIGFCLENLAERDRYSAVAAFQAVVDRYAEQTEPAALARERLQAIGISASPEDSVRKALEQFNLAFESKDPDRYIGSISKEWLDRITAAKKNGIQDWKNDLMMRTFSPWQSLKIDAQVKTIQRQGYGYLVREVRSISGTDWQGKDHLIKPRGDIYYTFREEKGAWKISATHEISLPAAYDSLMTVYPGMGNPGFAYVCHISQSFVSVISLSTGKLAGTIPTGNGASALIFSPDGTRGYVACYNSNDVTVFDTRTNKTITQIPAGEHPCHLALSTDGRALYIGHESADGLWILDTRENAIVFRGPEGTGFVAAAPKGERVYQSQIFRPLVLRFTPNGRSVERAIKVGGRPLGLAFTPDSRFAYVANYELNELEKIDARTDSVVGRIPGTPGARAIAITPDGTRAYVGSVGQKGILVVDLAKDSVVAQIPLAVWPSELAIAADGKRLYATVQSNATVVVIDLPGNKVVQTLTVADNPTIVTIR